MYIKILWLVVVALASVVVALVTGFLVWMDGASSIGAVLAGGAAFGGAFVLALAALTSLGVL